MLAADSAAEIGIYGVLGGELDGSLLAFNIAFTAYLQVERAGIKLRPRSGLG